MRIYPILRKITNRAKVLLVAGGLSFSPSVSKSTYNAVQDTFVKGQPVGYVVKAQNIIPKKVIDWANIPEIPHSGLTDPDILSFAPSCDTVVQGVDKKAAIVVDIAHRLLFRYDSTGVAKAVYPIATGKPSTPTDAGLRIVSHVETYPYRGAPAHTKRHRTPRSFGPKCIILDKLDANTGEISHTGEFIHGNNDSTSIGKAASKGCMRMDNEVIKDVSSLVKRGDLVIIRN